MTILECLKQGFNKLKQDTILFGPYLAFTLVNIVYSRYFLSMGDTITFMYITQLVGQHIIQTLCGFFLLIMLLNLRKDDVYVPLAFSLFMNRFNKYFWMSFLVNIPFSLLLYLGGMTLSVDASKIGMLGMIFLGIGVYVMVPLTAFGYFACIRYVMSPKSIIALLSETFLFCFQHYRVSLRWFWMMLTLNMLQIFILPLTVTNFILKDVLLAVFQSFILTLIMSFSVFYYKEFVSPFFRYTVSGTDSINLNDSVSPDEMSQGDGNDV